MLLRGGRGLMSHREPRAVLDYESRSACSIRACGGWKYSLDPSTEALCAAFRLPTWAPGRVELWNPALPSVGLEENCDWGALAELFQWIEDDGLVEAHNAAFEKAITTNIMHPKHGWPLVPPTSWRCSAAKAAALSLPRALADAINALNLDVKKDDEGAALMKRMVKPRKPNKVDWREWLRLHAPCPACKGVGRVASFKKDGTPTKKGAKCDVCGGEGSTAAKSAVPEMPVLYLETPELMQRLFAYCKQDVLAEEALSEYLPDLSPDETTIYLMDQAINERGFELDPDAIDTALELIDGEFTELNAELAELTDGQVTKASQRAKMVAWFAEHGLDLDDTQADTIDSLIDARDDRPDLSPKVWRALELMQLLGKSSTAKFVKMRDWICPDKRVHGGLLYHGASTGRWTGAGIQPHNFPRGTLKETPEVMWAFLKTRDRDLITDEFGSVMATLSSALRGVIVPAPGKQLYVSDFAGIEARVLLWVAKDEAGLDVFRQGKDIYCEMAASIYGYPVIANEADQPKERKLGKVAILGLGYQMGPSKFVETAWNLGGVTIVEDLVCTKCGKPSRKHRREHHALVCANPDEMTAVKVVDAYRTKFWRVKNAWSDQEAAAIKAVVRERGPHNPVECGRVAWFVDGSFLYCELPSGRRLAYPDAAVVDREMPWGDMKPSLTYMGISQFTRKWTRQNSYGGLLVENIVQAIARDLMAGAMLRAERSGVYTPILSVHDELLAEADIGVGSVREFNALMSELPVWAKGCPVDAAGWVGSRYAKA